MLQRSFKKLLCIVGLTVLMNIASAKGASEESDTIRQQFFDTLETTLRADYRLCTADSVERPLDFLLGWRQSIDSAVAKADYAIIVRKYTEETGISAARARPCEIVEWMRKGEQRGLEAALFLSAERDSLIRLHDDSVFLTNELKSLSPQGYDISGIPFGLSQRALLLLTRKRGIADTVTTDGTIISNSLIVGTRPFRSALHLSKENLYTWYELESATCSPDSLDSWARPTMEEVATDFESRTTQSPTHIYRVGHFDIVPGRLAICKLWEFHDAFAYIGLARIGNRFYTKAIVRRK